MTRTLTALLALVSVSFFAFVGCGTNPMSYRSLEAQLERPTGIVDSNTLSSAFAQFQAQQKSAPVTQDGISTLGQPLLASISASPQAFLGKAGVPKKVLGLLEPLQFEKSLGQVRGLSLNNTFGGLSCVEGDNPMQNDAEFTMDLGCMGSGTGKIHVVIKGMNLFAIAQSKAKEIAGEMQLTFHKACSANGQCVNGKLNLKMDVSEASGKVLTTYHLKAHQGSQELYTLKGGVRVQYGKAAQHAEVAVLLFVKNKEAREVSLVLEVGARGDSSHFAIRGQNGSFSCKAENNGLNGSCQAQSSKGEGSISWKI